MGYELTKAQGRVCCGGSAQRQEYQYILAAFAFRQADKRIDGGEAIPHVDIPRYFKLLDAGLIQLKP